MATLPSCMHWTFTNSGLLIQDWLLKPVRPVNLNEAINQLYLSSVIHSKDHLTSSIEGFNEKITDRTQQILQIIYYFSLPLLPAATILFVLVNIFTESKHYICPKYTLFTRPYLQRLSHYLIVFYVLTGINSSLIWLSTLPRYIPMSTGHYSTNTLINNHWYAVQSNSSKQYNTLRDMDIHHHYNATPKFISQLPAMLTMQIVLRLSLCWLTIGLLIDRIYILNELQMNPLRNSFGYYTNYLYTIAIDNLNEDTTSLMHLNDSAYKNCRQYKQPIQNTLVNSIIQYLLKFTANLCSIQKCSIKSCPICKQLDYNNWSNEYTCFVCKSNYTHNNKNNNNSNNSEILSNQQLKQQSEENLHLSSILHIKTIDNATITTTTTKTKTNCTSIGRLILLTGLLITCSLAICLPQVWSYQLIGINLKIKSTNKHTTEQFSNSNIYQHEKFYPLWRLLHKTGQTIYEYCFAAISFVIPCCTIIIN
ncbi:hypothetical protein MN116_007713 [Schistosoma mekongi]|uniref:Uncharacterized protein n=1 Tax=Schistosoma mekongi TaxID=38744 RepID=A0AAE1Z814_SCHME|nr:hypothetical protein MN116_007713 [Schistosoma mekongi]